MACEVVGVPVGFRREPRMGFGVGVVLEPEVVLALAVAEGGGGVGADHAAGEVGGLGLRQPFGECETGVVAGVGDDAAEEFVDAEPVSEDW